MKQCFSRDVRAFVQFGELVRQAAGGEAVMVWLLDQSVLLEDVCPVCNGERGHLLQMLQNENRFVCLVCGERRVDVLRAGGGAEEKENHLDADERGVRGEVLSEEQGRFSQRREGDGGVCDAPLQADGGV